MLNREYIFQLLKEQEIQTIMELSRVLGVNYFTLRYDLNRGTLRLELAVLLANFLKIPVSSLLINPVDKFIWCVEWNKKDVLYEVSNISDVHYLMFCILSSELL